MESEILLMHVFYFMNSYQNIYRQGIEALEEGLTTKTRYPVMRKPSSDYLGGSGAGDWSGNIDAPMVGSRAAFL